MGLITIDPAKKAAIDRDLALRAADEWFKAEQAKGFTTPGGWKLGLADSDIALLTGNYVLAKEASAMDLPLPPVVDMAGVPHSFESVEQLTSLMLLYGQHRSALSAEYAARKEEASN
jgi:hypothetical protein